MSVPQMDHLCESCVLLVLAELKPVFIAKLPADYMNQLSMAFAMALFSYVKVRAGDDLSARHNCWTCMIAKAPEPDNYLPQCIVIHEIIDAVLRSTLGGAHAPQSLPN